MAIIIMIPLFGSFVPSFQEIGRLAISVAPLFPPSWTRLDSTEVR